MAVTLKTKKEIEILAEGGKLLSQLLDELSAMVKPGATGNELDEYARAFIAKHSAKPSFLGYKEFPAAICVSVNEAVVHGMPNDEPFQEGDVVGVDAGIIYQGLYTDSARTVPAGAISASAQKLLAVTEQSLQIGIEAAQAGNTTGDIGHAIQAYVEGQGFGVVRELVGHGVGHGVHEEPRVPNYGRAGTGHPLEAGLVIAIEPMVTAGNPAIKTARDRWTIVTKDGGLTAHFEHTLAITPAGPRILTQ